MKDLLKKAFEHGKSLGIYLSSNIPDKYAPPTFDSWYDTEIVNELLPHVSGSDERWICKKCGELVDGRNVTFEEYNEECGGKCV